MGHYARQILPIGKVVVGMVYDIQRAGFWKRLSAWFLDVILLLILSLGIVLLLTSWMNVRQHYDNMENVSQRYEDAAGISFDITQEAYEAMTEEERANFDKVYAQFAQDEEAIYAYNMMINLTLLSVSLSIFVAYLVLEFVVPLLFGNGQTVGKKVFAIAVVRVNCVKIDGVALFIRSILGKYTIETMVPVMLIMMVLLEVLGIVGPVVILLILLLQVGLMIATRNNSTIHDCLANTVAVDLHSQMIFGNEAELMEYKKQIHQDIANRSTY